MTTPTDDLTHTNSGRITGRRVVNGRDVFTVSPAFGESFEVVRYEDDSGEAVAWLHDVVQGDGEPDQALSFSKDSFPLDTELGFRSLGSRPLFFHPAMTDLGNCTTCKGTGRQSYLMGDVDMVSLCHKCGGTGHPLAMSVDVLDAERYRWLREQGYAVASWFDHGWLPEYIDEGCDDAIARREGEGK